MKYFSADSDTTPDEFNGLQTGSQVIEATEEYRGNVDCQVSEWSPWSECLNCHATSYKIREVTVNILQILPSIMYK